MTLFPSVLYTASHVTDVQDDVMAVDVNTLQDEIEAIEKELGVNPAGAFATVLLALAESAGEKFTTSGQMLISDAANSSLVLAAPSQGQKLRGSTAGSPEWADDDFTIPFTFGDATNAITTAEPAQWIQFPRAGIIEGIELTADTSGSFVVDLWKNTYANFPPTDGNSITSSAPPTLSTAAKSQDSTLTGWTTSFDAGDYIYTNVDSSTTIRRVVLVIKGRWTE